MSGGTKHDQDKPRLELLPWAALSNVFSTDFSECIPTRLEEQTAWAIVRYLEGEDDDEETGESNLVLAAAGVLQSMDADMTEPNGDVPWEQLLEIAKVLTFGAKKYDAHDWRKGGDLTQTRVLGAALRHLAAHDMDEELDAETGLSHLAHAACELLFALTYAMEGRGDDRHTKVLK